MMKRNDRIYKSMSLEDLMSAFSFVFAKAGVYLLPIIQNFNYEKNLPCKQGLDLKAEFVRNIIKLLKDKNTNIEVTDMKEYYDIWITITP